MQQLTNWYMNQELNIIEYRPRPLPDEEGFLYLCKNINNQYALSLTEVEVGADKAQARLTFTQGVFLIKLELLCDSLWIEPDRVQHASLLPLLFQYLCERDTPFSLTPDGLVDDKNA